MKQSILILLLLFGGLSNLQAQKEASIKQDFPVHISIMDESISIPNFWFTRYSYNPAIMIGTEYTLKQKKNYDLHLTGNLGYYYHKDWQSTPFLLTELGYRYQLNRWSFYTRLGAGYAHVFSPKPIYKFEDGQFTEAKDWGSPYFIASFSLNSSFKLSDKDLSPEIYLTNMLSIELPFAYYSGFHHFVGVGCKFYPFKRA